MKRSLPVSILDGVVGRDELLDESNALHESVGRAVNGDGLRVLLESAVSVFGIVEDVALFVREEDETISWESEKDATHETHHVFNKRSGLGSELPASKRDSDPSAEIVHLADLPPPRESRSASDRLVDEDSAEVTQDLDDSIILVDPLQLALLLLLLDDLGENFKAVRCSFVNGFLPSSFRPELGSTLPFCELGLNVVVQGGEVGRRNCGGASYGVGKGVVRDSSGLQASECLGISVQSAKALFLVALQKRNDKAKDQLRRRGEGTTGSERNSRRRANPQPI